MRTNTKQKRLGRTLLKTMEAQANVIEPPPQRFKIYRGTEVIDLPPPDYQITGLWPAGSFVVLYGPPASAKSFLSLAWSLAIANGSDWLGRNCRPGQVVYTATEGQGSLGIRLQAWQKRHPKQSIASLGVITTAPLLLNEKDRQDFMLALRSLPEPPTLVVIDTLARTLVGGDENSAKDVGELVAAVDRMRDEFGSTILLVHHTGKSKNGERGSSALRGAADVMLRTHPISRQPPTIRLHCEKAKDAPAFKPFTLELAQVKVGEGESSCVLINGDWRPARNKSADGLLSILTSELESRQVDSMTSGEWQQASGLSDSNFKRALKSLKNAKQVQAEKVGKAVKYWPARTGDAQQGPTENEVQ